MLKLNKLELALVFVILFQLLYYLYTPTGISFFKILITFLIWGSAILSMINYLKNYRNIKNQIGHKLSFIIVLLYSWSFILIFKSLLFESVSYTTILGNQYTALALLVPPRDCELMS